MVTRKLNAADSGCGLAPRNAKVARKLADMGLNDGRYIKPTSTEVAAGPLQELLSTRLQVFVDMYLQTPSAGGRCRRRLARPRRSNHKDVALRNLSTFHGRSGSCSGRVPLHELLPAAAPSPEARASIPIIYYEIISEIILI